MAGLAKVSLPPVPAGDSSLIDRRNGKPKRITPKVRKAVRLLLDGSCRTLKAAAEQVGVSAEYISRALRQPHVLAYVDEQARARLAAGKMLATSRLLELIHATSEHVSFDAASHALAINGIRPVGDSPIVSVSVSPGYCIDVISDPREALAANHPRPELRMIDGDTGKVVSEAPTTPAPQRATPPFPDLVQTGVNRVGPVFSYRSPDNDEPT